MTVKAIIDKLNALNIKRVAVFDDEIEFIVNPWKEDITWKSIFNAYTTELEAALGVSDVERLRNLESVEERLDALSTIEKHLTLEVLEALQEETVKILRLWIKKLESFGLEVDKFVDFDDFKNKCLDKEQYKICLRGYHLILVDFHFKHQPDEIHSQSISKEISDLLYPRSSDIAIIPPILIRFSSLNLSEYSVDEKNKFVREIGFARGCYEFLRKNLINEEEKFISSMMRIIRDAEYGRPLYTFSLNIAKTISQTAASEMMRILYQLEPESIRIISDQRLKVEGITALDYFSKLFLGLLNHIISGSEEVVDATRDFLDSINDQVETISTFEHDGLDYVQNRLLFDYQINAFQKPINFGDIFLFKDKDKDDEHQDQVGIVITQACDMAIRGQTSTLSTSQDSTEPSYPKVKYVMLLTGTLISSSISSNEKNDRFTRSFARAPKDKDYLTIKWNFNNPITLPRNLLDLASIKISGKVILPIGNLEIQSNWWTKAYQGYINLVCRDLRKNSIEFPDQVNEGMQSEVSIPNGNKEFKRIILSSTISDKNNLSDVFGNVLMFSVEKDCENLTFPIQRIARLQLDEALNLQHTYHANASRIGVMFGLSQEYTVVNIELYTEKTEPFATISAKRFDMKNWKALITDSHELEIACEKEDSFSNLAKFAIHERPYLDLEKISKQEEFLADYVLIKNKVYCQIKRIRKQKPSNQTKGKSGEKISEPDDVQLEDESKCKLLKDENQILDNSSEKSKHKSD